VLVLQALVDRLSHVLDKVGHAEGAEGPKREASDGRVTFSTVLVKLIDGQEGEVRYLGSIVGNVEVKQLLEDEVIRA
jgi:hypothetical protein